MKLINIKEEVKELEASNKRYETVVEAVYKNDTWYRRLIRVLKGLPDAPILSHKHIFIPDLSKRYVRTNDLQWYLLEGECDYCV